MAWGKALKVSTDEQELTELIRKLRSCPPELPAIILPAPEKKWGLSTYNMRSDR